ncbi:MAG: type IV secretory system conjugative DNA transfer family protein [Pseudomonadota bacterium]
MVGFAGNRPIYWNGAGGALLIAGARSGKLRDVLGYNICAGTYAHSMLVLDMKGELAAISQDQTKAGKHCLYWNPAGLHGLPQHRINPVDYIRKDSPTLVSDVKVFCQNFFPKSGGDNSEYFDSRAQAFGEAVILTITYLDEVLTLPRLYEVLNLIPGNSEEWMNFAYDMHQCGFPIAKAVEEEIAASRDSSSNGFQGILGTIMKGIASLSDPALMVSVSPPFTASMADMCGSKPTHVNLMPPAEFIESWSPVIKALFVAGMIYKSRAPQAKPQTWIIDECAQLGAFPLVTRMFTYGAGIGIRPWAIYQSLDQLKATGPEAQNIIPASAACQSWFGVRDYPTAKRLSDMLGSETLEYNESLSQRRANLSYQQSIDALLTGGDPIEASLHLAHYDQASRHRSKQQRLLRSPDEILNMPEGKQFIFADGLDHPAYADRKPYYEQRFMAGRYHPNPYYPPLDRVRVKALIGHKWLRVRKSPVPSRYAGYPQYAGGQWSFVDMGQ